MQNKTAFLVCAIAALVTFSQAFAQSSHDSSTGSDPDFLNNPSNFRISSTDGRFSLKFSGHLQHNNHFNYRGKGDHKFKMSIHRARLKLLGTAFDPSLSYFFQAQFENDEISIERGDKRSRLRDFYVNLDMHDNASLRFGKFRTPFSRQQLLSTSQMQFYDQNMANNFFELNGTGRDIGVMVHNGFNQPVEYALALVENGAVLRVGYNYGGIDGYETADFTGGPLRFAIAANGYWKTDWNNFDDLMEDVRGGIDFIVKVNGFSTNGAFYLQRVGDQNKMGAGLDLGYMIGGNIEPVLRVSWLDAKAAGDNAYEALLGLNYYVYGHHLKAQAYGGANILGKDIKEYQGGLQLQFAL